MIEALLLLCFGNNGTIFGKVYVHLADGKGVRAVHFDTLHDSTLEFLSGSLGSRGRGGCSPYWHNYSMIQSAFDSGGTGR